MSSGGPDSDINANADSQPCSVGTMHNICLTESTLTSGCTYNRQRIHTAYRCRFQQHKTPQYVTDCVTPALDIASRQRLRSASLYQLLVPRYQLRSLGRRSFAVAGPPTWNSLSADLRDPTCSDESFRRSLKTFLFAKY